MNPNDLLTADHKTLRQEAGALKTLAEKDAKKLGEALASFQSGVQKHFRREDIYYRTLDDGKRVGDRGLMHQLRNDHAAVVFMLESLAIRLRKNGATPEWRTKLETLLGVFLPHLDHEEKQLFPQGAKTLSPAELESISREIERASV